jgi:hypothetical protein
MLFITDSVHLIQRIVLLAKEKTMLQGVIDKLIGTEVATVWK